MQGGVIARTIILDREIQKFINEYPDAICISMGNFLWKVHGKALRGTSF